MKLTLYSLSSDPLLLQLDLSSYCSSAMSMSSETSNAAIEKDDDEEFSRYRDHKNRHRQEEADGKYHRTSLMDPGHASDHMQPASHSSMPFLEELTDPDGQGQHHHHHGHHHHHLEASSSSTSNAHAHANRGSSLGVDRFKDHHMLDSNDHHHPPSFPSSPSATSIEPISSSSPDNEAPLSMSDASEPSPPLQPPRPPPSSSSNLPPTSKPKLARVSSDPVPSSSSSSAFTPLSFQNQPAPLPVGNRPAGTALPSHMNHNSAKDTANHQPSAGPSTSSSRSTKYADPDSHWLSEDEGESFIDDLRNSRQSPRRRGGPRLRSNYPISSFNHPDDDDDDNQHGGKNSISAAGAASSASHCRGDSDARKRRSRTASSIAHQQEELFVDSSIADPVVVVSPSIPPASSAIEPEHATATLEVSQLRHTEAPRRRSSPTSKESRSPSSLASTAVAPTPAPPPVKYDSDANAAYKDYAPFIKDLSAITPSLLKALTCPSCRKLMSDPTTLACGHSECLLCVAPKAASVLLRKTSPTSTPIAITAAVLTMEEEEEGSDRFDRLSSAHHPGLQQSLPPPPLYSSSHLEASSEQKSPRAILADGVCPIVTCKKVTKATANGRQGLRVDVVLQKLAYLLKSRVILDDEDEDDMQDAQVVGRGGNHLDTELIAPSPRRPSTPMDTLLDVDPEEQGSLSEPILRASPQSPRLSRSRSYLRASSPEAASSGRSYYNTDRESGPSNTSSPDEETKSEENAKRSMKTKSYSKSSGRTLKKSRAAVPSSSPLGLGKSQHSHQQQRQKANQAGLPMLVTDILSELECHICVTMMYEPITTTCGHTFCKKCLLRSLDHSNRCPLCRSELPGMSYFIHAPINFTLSNLLVTTFPILYEQRKDLLKQEENESGLDTPIFVCMVSFPFMPTNLHIYEPRYRLMMRRALDTNKRFGMVLPSRTTNDPSGGGFIQYGTMLEIKNMHVFEDGRSLVETIGISRFKVLESGTLDGYTVGRIERIDDIDDEEEAELERSALARSSRLATAQSNIAAAAGRRTSSTSSSAAAGSIGVIDEKSPTASGQTSHHNHQSATTTTTTIPSSRPTTGLRSLSFSRHRSSSSSSANNNNNINNNNTRRVSPPIPNQNVDPAAGTTTTSGNPNDASSSDSTELTNQELIDICKNFVEALRTGSTPWLLQRLNNSLPPMPEDPREFTWWMAMLMPIDDHEKARLLQVCCAFARTFFRLASCPPFLRMLEESKNLTGFFFG